MMGDKDKNAILSCTPPTSASASMSSSPALSPTTVCLDESNQDSGSRVTVRILKDTQDDSPNYRCVNPIHSCRRHYSGGAVTIWKIFALYFVIILMFGFVYIYTGPADVREEFNVTIAEERVDDVLMSISYQHSEQIVYLQCLPKDDTETMFDLEQNLVAHKDTKGERCYVRSALSRQFVYEYEQVKDMLKVHSHSWKRPDEIIPMIVLRRKVNAEVLRNVAGEHIAEFCGNFKTHWLVSSVPNSYDSGIPEQPNPSVSSRVTPASISCSFYRIALRYKS